MILVAAPPDGPPSFTPLQYQVDPWTDDRDSDGLRVSAVSRSFVGAIRFGNHRYPLRRPLRGEYLPAPVRILDSGSSRPGRARVEGLPGSRFVGLGDTAEQAWANWHDRIHTEFQRLWGMRPFERTSVDRHDWEALRAVIDTAGYERTEPVRVREVGQLLAHEPGRRRVRWVHRNADEPVSSALTGTLPPEFAALRAGRWFEMTSLRSRSDGSLLGGEALSVLVDSPFHATDDEWEEFEASWQPTDRLPAATWD